MRSSAGSKGKEKIFFAADHEFSIPEIKIIIDALQTAGFVTEKKTAELVEKIAMIGGSHKTELLKSSMVRFNTRKHTNESILYTVDSITFTFGADIFYQYNRDSFITLFYRFAAIKEEGTSARRPERATRSAHGRD